MTALKHHVPTCEHCGTNDETADIKGVTESMYWMELCECCRESLEVRS